MKKKEEILNFEAIRPFGPTIVRGKMPKSLIKLIDDKASEMLNNKEYSKKFDHAPHLGQFGGGNLDGMFYAMGYCGSGVARSTYFGTKLGLKMLGASDSETAFDDLEFETRAFYNGDPWFMSAILNWHRFAERLGF